MPISLREDLLLSFARMLLGKQWLLVIFHMMPTINLLAIQTEWLFHLEHLLTNFFS